MAKQYQAAIILIAGIIGLALCNVASAAKTAAEIHLVSTQVQYNSAIKAAKPGDTIVLAKGTWQDFEIVFEGRGTPDQPITLTAEEKGAVIISGRSNLRIAGEHLVVSGLVFRDGYTPTNTVIAFRRTKGVLANHTRVTEVVIDNFNNPERFETDFWVMMYGRDNRFDHNHLAGKKNAGVTMAVKLDSEDSQQNNHRIDHNYFGPRPVLGSNGGETLRIGTSKYSLTRSNTLIENNYFDRCNGEVEIVSNKSGSNTFRGNVFFESRGTLTLRHGNDNLVENNVFLGNNVDHTGGIRVINKRQTIRNNYLSGLTGHRFGAGLVVMNGVPNSPINRYHQVEEADISNNTLIDISHIELAAGADKERSARPLTVSFRNNALINQKATDSIAVHDDISGISFSDNLVSGVAVLPREAGFQQTSGQLEQAENGLWYPADNGNATIGASRSLQVIAREQTGTTWYAKPDANDRFSGGTIHNIQPGNDQLFDAVSQSSAGDTIVLAAGDYTETKIVALAHPISIIAADQAATRPIIRFERSTLFQIDNGGSLKLKGIVIDGSLAPDTYGNSAVRTTRYSMLDNYQLLIDDIHVRQLDVNHSFHFLKIAKHTFADRIDIRNAKFSNITGNVIALDREDEDLGIYNAEYVDVHHSQFERIGGTLLSAYRGGTDESTFGPHIMLIGNTLNNVGLNKRNKHRTAVFLQGAQRVDIHNNSFENTAGIKVIETVGEPKTTIAENTLTSTPKTTVVTFGQAKQ